MNDVIKWKRNWRSWLKRIAESVSRTEIIVGLTGLGFTISAQPYLQVPGALVLIAILIFIGYRTFPDRLLSVASLASTEKFISPDQLLMLDTSVVSIGAVGAKQTGKSTFLNYAFQIPDEPVKTSSIAVRVVPVPRAVPQIFCALVDGDGDQFSQQFDVCDHVDVLFVFLDHNSSSAEVIGDADRLKEHSSFLNQLRAHLNRNKDNQPCCIHFVLNKRDLWEKNIDIKRYLVSWFEEVAKEWDGYGMAKSVTFSSHSNLKTKDIQDLTQLILESTSKQ